MLTLNCSASKVNVNVLIFVSEMVLFYWSTSWCVGLDCKLLPEQHDDFPLPSNCTRCAKSIRSPPSIKSLLRSYFFHSRTAIKKAADTFSDVLADVSMKLTTWNSWHQVNTSSGVISRSLAGTSFWKWTKNKPNYFRSTQLVCKTWKKLS